jgi:hypothetical protein
MTRGRKRPISGRLASKSSALPVLTRSTADQDKTAAGTGEDLRLHGILDIVIRIEKKRSEGPRESP